MLIHAFITSHMDYCDALLFGLSVKTLAHLQYIQNSAARLLTHTNRTAHITAILYHQHFS